MLCYYESYWFCYFDYYLNNAFVIIICTEAGKDNDILYENRSVGVDFR